MPIAYGFSGIPDSTINSEIDTEYGKDEEKKTYAQQVAQIAAAYTRENPPPPEEGTTRKARRAYRRASRRVIAKRAHEQIKPVGFVGGFVFMAILSGIISWIIQRLLSHYYGEPDAKTARMEAMEDAQLLNDLDKLP